VTSQRLALGNSAEPVADGQADKEVSQHACPLQAHRQLWVQPCLQQDVHQRWLGGSGCCCLLKAASLHLLGEH